MTAATITTSSPTNPTLTLTLITPNPAQQAAWKKLWAKLLAPAGGEGGR